MAPKGVFARDRTDFSDQLRYSIHVDNVSGSSFRCCGIFNNDAAGRSMRVYRVDVMSGDAPNSSALWFDQTTGAVAANAIPIALGGAPGAFGQGMTKNLNALPTTPVIWLGIRLGFFNHELPGGLFIVDPGWSLWSSSSLAVSGICTVWYFGVN